MRWCRVAGCCSGLVGDRSDICPSDEPFSTMVPSASGLSWMADELEGFGRAGEHKGVL